MWTWRLGWRWGGGIDWYGLGLDYSGCLLNVCRIIGSECIGDREAVVWDDRDWIGIRTRIAANYLGAGHGVGTWTVRLQVPESDRACFPGSNAVSWDVAG